MKGHLTFLGTGNSVGVPLIGCSCQVCTSSSPYNKRLRPSAFVRYAGRKFLIDAGPDLRRQALTYGIVDLDGVLFTHAHYDHTAGIDDLRPFYFSRERPLPLLLSKSTAADIERRFYYLFERKEDRPAGFRTDIFSDSEGEVIFEGVKIRYFTYRQSGMPVNGFRIGNFAYVTDMKEFSDSVFRELDGIRYLVISALRFTPSPLHLSVDEAIDFSVKTKAEKVWLTHISHEMDHRQTSVYLPPNIRPAYDGLEIEFD